MVASIAEGQSCGPQLIETEIPSRAWGLDRLSVAAVDEYQRLLNDERLLTAHYWRLGRLLRLSPQRFSARSMGCVSQPVGHRQNAGRQGDADL